MPLPAQIQVRISSEAAGSISLTPVVNQTIPFRELVEVILSTTGKDAARVRDLLARGAVVQGASRFRWQGLAGLEDRDVAEALASFPDPDPSRVFSAERCIGVRLRAGRQTMEVPRRVAEERRMLRSRSFWDALMEVAASTTPKYVDYSYRTRSDQYTVALPAADLPALQKAAGLLRYSGLISQIGTMPVEWIEYSVRLVD